MDLKNLQKQFLLPFFFLFLAALSGGTLHSDEFTSTDFKVLDPVINSAEYSTSNNFKLFGVIAQMAIGTSTSGSFNLSGGFLYFPFVSTPAVSVTAGNTQAALTWTSASASTGWTVGSYAVGQSSASGGPYTYTDVGNVLASTRTGLSNGTTYYFVVRVADSLGNYIATSTEVSGLPVSTGGSSSGGSSGGGGGGGGGSSGDYGTAGVTLSGRAYPLSRVSILKDGQLVVTTIAGPDSKFKTILNNLSAGGYTFSVYSEDTNRVRSSPFTFPVTLTTGVMTEISGIFIAPTISVDKLEVKRGDTITIFGQSAQTSDIVVSINSEQEFFVNKIADANGIYLINFDSSPLEFGEHSAKSKASHSGEISYFSHTVGFTVGTKNVATVQGACNGKADLNADCRVNLVDFSIAAFWYKKTLSNTFKEIEKGKLNGDGKIDLVDFSIMAYQWTG